MSGPGGLPIPPVGCDSTSLPADGVPSEADTNVATIRAAFRSWTGTGMPSEHEAANAALDALVADRDKQRTRIVDLEVERVVIIEQREVAEAERDRLAAALQKIADHGTSSHAWAWCNKVAREALAGVVSPQAERTQE